MDDYSQYRINTPKNIPYVIMAWLVLCLNNCDLTKVDSYRVFMANQSRNMDHVPVLFLKTQS